MFATIRTSSTASACGRSTPTTSSVESPIASRSPRVPATPGVPAPVVTVTGRGDHTADLAWPHVDGFTYGVYAPNWEDEFVPSTIGASTTSRVSATVRPGVSREPCLAAVVAATATAKQ